MQDLGYELPRIPLLETVWKIARGFLIVLVFSGSRERDGALRLVLATR